MPTPEQQKEYTRLSGLLRTIARRHLRELPKGATSLVMKIDDQGKVIVEVYDRLGNVIGTVPNEKTSPIFRAALRAAFAHTVSPDPDGVIAMI